MRPSTAPCTILSIAALSYCSLAAFTLDITRSSVDLNKLTRKSLSRRATIVESLLNNVTAGSYTASVSVGTPPQQLTLIVDTGSSDVWLLDVTADLCNSPAEQAAVGLGGCVTPYNHAKSSTFKDILPGQFQIQYADNSNATGDYVTDDFTIGGSKIKALQMGLALNSTIVSGLIGVGYDINEASDNPQDGQEIIYPSIIDSLVSQSLINTKAYSLYLNDLQASTGSIIFGGIDTDKYHGQLLQTPVVAEPYLNTTAYVEFLVALTSVSVTGQAGNTSALTTSLFSESHLLDSGTTFSYLPSTLATQIYNQLGAIDDSLGTGLVFIDCDITTNSPRTTLNFGFGSSAAESTPIKVPIDELVFSLAALGTPTTGNTLPVLPFTNVCVLGIFGTDEAPYVLGDSFLRSAYVLYDLKNNLIGIAQTNFNSTTSNVVEIKADATAIPTVTGVATSAVQTATGKATGTGTGPAGTGTSTGTTSTTSKSAAVGMVGSFDVTALVVLGATSVFAVLGGGWFLV